MRKGDLIAGVSVAGLILPEAVAYAGIAGLPPQKAIFGAFAGCLAYSIIGKSRFAIVTPTSSSAVIIAATFAALPGTVGDKTVLVTIMAAIVAIVFLAASLMHLGNLSGFISRPVLRGFAFGLAVTIILRQLPALTGVSEQAADIFHLTLSLVSSVPNWHIPSIILGVASLAALLLLRRAPFLPGTMLVLAAGIAASWLFQLPDYGVEVVGKISIQPVWPAFSLGRWQDLVAFFPFALPLVLILYAESWGTIRSLALRHADRVTANRELGALGLANLASALVQGMPVGAGFSAGSASEAAGAQSRATAIIAALGLALLVIFAADPVARLPRPVLAAVVIAALTHALNPMPFFRLWQLRRDSYVAMAAALGVMAFGVLNGVILAMALSLAALLRRLASPYAARLGRLGDGHDFVDVSRHNDAVPVANISIWRPAQPLFFANADAMLNTIAANIQQEQSTRAAIVSLEESFDLDSTALEVLLEFDTTMNANGKHIQYARVHHNVLDLLIATAPELAQRCSFSVDDAVSAAMSMLSQSGEAK